MMKYLIWIIIVSIALNACSSHNGYTITGEFPDANGLQITLKKITADAREPVTIDSCTVKKGKFRMKGMVQYPEYCLLYAGNNGPLRLFVENTVIHVAFDLKNMQDSKLAGSMETDLLAVYDAQTDTSRQQRIEFLKQMITENPNYIATAMIVDNELRYHMTPEELMQCVNGFDEANRQSSWVQSLMENTDAARRLADSIYVDLKMSTPDGIEIALSDFAGKGKYLLINFWASWCKSCRTDNPGLVKLYRKYHDKGFEIVGISLDKDKTEWVKAIEVDELVWPQMSDLNFWHNQGAKRYSVMMIPYTVLLDSEGTIIACGLECEELEKKLAELID